MLKVGFTHLRKKILFILHNMCMLLTLNCNGFVSDLPLNKQKIAGLISKLKISFFFFFLPLEYSQQLGSRLVLFFPLLSLKKLLVPYLSAGMCPEASWTHLILVDQSPACYELSFLIVRQKPYAAPS